METVNSSSPRATVAGGGKIAPIRHVGNIRQDPPIRSLFGHRRADGAVSGRGKHQEGPGKIATTR
ncbi:MAG: hypothetical protein MZV70_41320 [Desulfobacterales bacterium]|nr:hypothetical protein [Desulfobacterales bacterium]